MTAILGGGDFVQGAAAAGLNELAAQQLAEQLPESELLQNLVAVTIGSAIGGQQGGLITGTADRYNRQLHPMEVEFLIDEERVERYRAYLQQQDPDRVLTYEEAKRALVRYGTAYMDKSWALVFGRDDATEAFIQSEKQGLGLTYEDQYGQQHEFLDWSQESYENERINLKALFTEYGDNTAVKDYIKAIYNEAGQEDALERYQLGKLEGYKQASAEAHLGKDLLTLAEGVLSLPSDLIKTLTDNEFGPLDSEQMEVYYEALLKLQGRYEDAGYLKEYVHATTQRLTVLGLPASQAMGYALLSASKAVSIRIAAGKHKPVEVAGQQTNSGDKVVGSGSATNRTATEIDVAVYFQQNRTFWTQDPIQYNGNKVYQRNDLIDPNRVSEWTVRGQTVSGTNIERMAAGRAPIGPDGNTINLHHLTQRQDGAIAEVTQTLHSKNHGILHMPNTVPSSINRSQFNTWSRNYWKERASNWGQ